MKERQVDANRVIDKLTNQIKQMSLDIALLQTESESKDEIIDKQQKVIDAYEDKEKAAKK